MSRSEKPIESQRDKTPFRESEEHYRAVAEAATDAIITIDSDGTILVVNPAAERIFGYSNNEMIGQPLDILIPEYLPHRHKTAVQLPGLHKSGAGIPLEISFAEFTGTIWSSSPCSTNVGHLLPGSAARDHRHTSG